MNETTRTCSPVFFLFALLLASACGPSASGDGDSCAGAETRCVGDSFQACSGDAFETLETCAGSTVCDPTIGCAECSPAGGTFCSGDFVVACDEDGSIGGAIETCDPGTCSGGFCGSPTDSCGAAGVELIYVVTRENVLLSFDPLKLGGGDPFAVVGNLSCPAGPALGGLPGQPATPFSMSVDRNALAWVLYSSGEIFHVSTEDATCTATSFATRQQGFELFGMGFVSDAAGSEQETLYVAGGAATAPTPGDLGVIDTTTMTISRSGALPAGEFGPELTGTGDGKLFGYYPSSTNSYVGEMDRSTGANNRQLPLANLAGAATAWAFAHYGGKVYIFITTDDGVFVPNPVSRVLEVDLTSGNEATAIATSTHIVVGAGVSTCAPVVIE